MTSDNPNTDTEPTLDRRTVLRNGALAAGGLAFGTAAFAGATSADKWDKRTDQTGVVIGEDGSDALIKRCLGETLTVTSGTALFDVDVRSDGNGGYHANMRFIVKNVKAEGNDTDRTYKSNLASSETVNGDFDNKPFTLTGSTHLDFVSQGPGPDFRAKSLQHVTVNANGDLTVAEDYFAVDCRK